MNDFGSCFDVDFTLSSYMRGLATIEVFEQQSEPEKEPDSPDVRRHLHICLHAVTPKHTHAHRDDKRNILPLPRLRR